LTLGELPEEILVGPSEDVRLNVVEAEAVPAQYLDECGQALVVHDPLSCRGGVEVHYVDHALEAWVLSGDRSNCIRQLLADPGGLPQDRVPSGDRR
jgi:hypothetical protein